MRKITAVFFMTFFILVSGCGTVSEMTEIVFSGQTFNIHGTHKEISSNETGAGYEWQNHFKMIFASTPNQSSDFLEYISAHASDAIANFPFANSGGNISIDKTRDTNINECKSIAINYSMSNGGKGMLFVMEDQGHDQVIMIAAFTDNADSDAYFKQLSEDLEN